MIKELGLELQVIFNKGAVMILPSGINKATGLQEALKLLGTSIGTTVIVDDIVVPIDVGLIKLSRKERLMDRLSKVALKRDGKEHWTEAVVEAIELLQNVFKPDETVLGGGNAKLVDPLPANCRCVDNRSAYVGAQRLWEGSDLFASACPTSWRIHRNEAHI